MAQTRQIKSWLIRCGVGAALTVLIGGVMLTWKTVEPKLVHPSYDLPFLPRPLLSRFPVLRKFFLVSIPSDVVLVELDDDSHVQLGQPYNASWDRAVHARLIERLTTESARAAAFDILFTDPHPTKPAGDERFARAIKANGKVILGVEFTFTADGAPTIVRAIDPFLDAAADWGFVEVKADKDFMVRRHMHVPPHPDADSFSSLAWQTARFLKAPEAQKPEDRNIERWVNYYGKAGTITSISIHRALEVNEFCPAGFFSNKVVFVGANVPTKFSGERKDEFVSPYSSAKTGFIPGVEVQATQFLNLLHHDWFTRFSPRAEWVVVLLAGLLFGIGLTLFRPLTTTGLALLSAGLVTLLAYYIFWRNRIWFPWLVIVAAQIPIAMFWSIVYNSVSSYIQNKLLEQSLGLYLSPKQVQRILKEPGLRKPGGSKQVISILFSDIAGFSRISEQLDPQDLVQLLNNYYEATIRCIHQTEGTVVDIIGDAIFAIWNAPEAQEDHKDRMVRAALLFHQNLKQFNSGQGNMALRTRVGLHTGEVVVGNVGSSEHFDYTAIGENVNLSSRLEGLNKHLGTDVLMTREAIPKNNDQWLLRDVGRFLFKGFEKVAEVTELVVVADGSSEQMRPWLDSFANALQQFQKRNFAAAEEGFKRTIELRGEDGPSKFYLKQIAEMQEHPVPDDWTGDTEMKEK